MVLDFSKASNEQLWNIIENDWDIPGQHIENLVTEGLNRNMFDPLIKHLIHKKFNRWDRDRRFQYYDLYSLGYIGIVIAAKNYKPGRGSFKTFAYMNIKTEFNHYLEKRNTKKRKVYDCIISLNVQKHEDNEESFLDSLMDMRRNPETIVLDKLYWEEQFRKLSQREKDALIYFAQGYSMNDIAQKYHLKSSVPIYRAFHRGILKINPEREPVNLKTLGLTSKAKMV